MKQSNKKQSSMRQNGTNVEISEKHQVNLKSNSVLYFQIGLILCLLGSYFALESSVEKRTSQFVYANTPETEDIEYTFNDYEIYEEPVKEETTVERKETPVITDVVEVTKNETKEAKEDLEILTEKPKVSTKKALSTEAPDLNTEKPTEPVSILAVQFVPVYPGCENETTNVDRRKCMSDKLGKLIKKQFDADLGSDLGLQGRQKIDVLFKINKQGEVVILKTRAPRKELEKEAERVIGKVPTMQPGKNGNNAVDVLYSLPIIFDIQN